MAVRQKKDGRWIVYYRDPEGKKKDVLNEYFGRGPEGKLKAIQRDSELGLKTRRPSKTGPKGPTLFDLSVLYMKYKGSSPDRWNNSKFGLRQLSCPGSVTNGLSCCPMTTWMDMWLSAVGR